MKLRSVLPMRIAKYGYMIVSAVFCAAGISMILLPAPSAQAIGIFCGIAMLLFGIIKLVGYYSKDLYRLAFQYDFQFGILLMILGVLTLLHPGNAMNFICISFGVCMIAESLFKAKIAFDAKLFGIREWWLTLIMAVLNGLAGLLLAYRPDDATQVIMTLLGIAMLAEGLLNLSTAISLVKIVKHQIPDVIDADDYEILGG